MATCRYCMFHADGPTPACADALIALHLPSHKGLPIDRGAIADAKRVLRCFDLLPARPARASDPARASSVVRSVEPPKPEPVEPKDAAQWLGWAWRYQSSMHPERRAVADARARLQRSRCRANRCDCMCRCHLAGQCAWDPERASKPRRIPRRPGYFRREPTVLRDTPPPAHYRTPLHLAGTC